MGNRQPNLQCGLLACGTAHTVALALDGHVCSTGDNRAGQCNTDTWNRITGISCGADFTVGVREDGTVCATGNNLYGQCNVSNLFGVTDVACGARHTAALRRDGTVVCLGDNSAGQCDTVGWEEIVFLCCGGALTLGIDRAGHLHLCGRQKKRFAGSARWERLVFAATDGNRICAIDRDGRLYSLPGLGQKQRRQTEKVRFSSVTPTPFGVIAIGTDGSPYPIPEKLLPLCPDTPEDDPARDSAWVMCAAGAAHVALLRRDGRVLSVGDNRAGQCETGTWKLFLLFSLLAKDRERLQKQRALRLSRRRARAADARKYSRRISCGPYASAAITSAGNLLTAPDLCRADPQSDVVSVSLGSTHLLALHGDGTVSAVGINHGGCCNTDRWQSVVAVCAGKDVSYGLRGDGSLLVEGSNTTGQCRVTDWEDITAIACTEKFVVGLSYGRTMRAAGAIPFPIKELLRFRDIVSFAVSEDHVAGLCADGTAVACGENGYGQCNVGDWQNLTAVACGAGYTIGLCADGSVVATGNNSLGQCNTESFREIAAIACGSAHTVGLCADGSVVATGADLAGQCRTGSFSDVVAIACGDAHTIALTADGHVLATGDNRQGQCETADFCLFSDAASSEKQPDIPENTALSSPDLSSSGASAAEPAFPAVCDPYRLAQIRRDCARYAARVSVNRDCSTLLDENGNVLPVNGKGAPSPVPFLCPDGIEIAACDRQMFVRRQDGTVWASEGNITLPDSIPFAQIACGKDHIALRTPDGKVPAYGDDTCGQCDTSDFSDITAIACGAYHTVGLCRDGHVVAVGADCRFDENGEQSFCGQLDLQDIRDAVAIVCGNAVSAGIRADGTVFARGDNRYGQCETDAFRNVVSLVCASGHTLALCADGSVCACGDNRTGACDTGSWKNIVMIAAATDYSAGLCADGTVVFAGSPPASIPDAEGIRWIGAGEEAFYAVCADGMLYRCDRAGVAGFPLYTPTASHGIFPRIGKNAGDPAAIAAFADSFGITLQNDLYLDPDGRLYIRSAGGTDLRQNIRALACGNFFFAALDTDGNVFASARAPSLPVPADGATAVSLACSAYNIALVTDMGTVIAAGDNRFGQCDTASVTDALRAVWGLFHLALLHTGGTVSAYGDNRYGQCETADWTDIVDLACGETFTVGVCRDGTLRFTSDAPHPEILRNAQGILSLAASPDAVALIRQDGTVLPVGFSDPYTFFFSALSDTVSLHCSEYRVAALCADGSVRYYPSPIIPQNKEDSPCEQAK